jgi:hypothetical protein
MSSTKDGSMLLSNFIEPSSELSLSNTFGDLIWRISLNDAAIGSIHALSHNALSPIILLLSRSTCSPPTVQARTRTMVISAREIAMGNCSESDRKNIMQCALLRHRKVARRPRPTYRSISIASRFALSGGRLPFAIAHCDASALAANHSATLNASCTGSESHGCFCSSLAPSRSAGSFCARSREGRRMIDARMNDECHAYRE